MFISIKDTIINADAVKKIIKQDGTKIGVAYREGSFVLYAFRTVSERDEVFDQIRTTLLNRK